MRRLWIILGCALAVVALSAFMIANPWQLGVTKSARFSLRRFASVTAGMQIGDVVKILGAPIRVASDVREPLCPPGKTCRNFVFADGARWWVISYKKAWVIVDDTDRVVKTVAYQEP